MECLLGLLHRAPGRLHQLPPSGVVTHGPLRVFSHRCFLSADIVCGCRTRSSCRSRGGGAGCPSRAATTSCPITEGAHSLSLHIVVALFSDNLSPLSCDMKSDGLVHCRRGPAFSPPIGLPVAHPQLPELTPVSRCRCLLQVTTMPANEFHPVMLVNMSIQDRYWSIEKLAEPPEGFFRWISWLTSDAVGCDLSDYVTFIFPAMP